MQRADAAVQRVRATAGENEQQEHGNDAHNVQGEEAGERGNGRQQVIGIDGQAAKELAQPGRVEYKKAKGGREVVRVAVLPLSRFVSGSRSSGAAASRMRKLI